MLKELLITLAITLSYTSYIIACGCAPLTYGKLTIKEFNDYDVVVKAIVTDVSGPALREENNSNKKYHVDSYGYHQVENKPEVPSEIGLKITRTIKGTVDRNLKVVVKNAEKYGYYCSHNKVEPGKSYYFFLNKNDLGFEMLYTSRLISLKSDYNSHAYLEKLKNESSKKNLEELAQRQLDHKIIQLEGSMKMERETKAQNLSFINRVNTNTSSKWYNEDKKLEAIGKLEYGVPAGEWEYYGYEGKFVAEKGSYKKGKRHGEWFKFFNKSENLLSSHFYKNGVLEGKYINYFNDGITIHDESNYKNGLKEGVLKSYHKSGEVRTISHYKKNKLNGKLIGYLQNGDISLKENYLDGKREGVFIRYTRSGILRDVLSYENDLPFGKYYRYFEDGSMEQEGQYNSNGVRTGEWKYYNRDGSIRTVELLDENGNLALESQNN